MRQAVHNGLAQLKGNERAAALLALALEIDPEPRVRRNLARSLKNLGVTSEPVVEALKAALEDDDRETRVNAAEAMQRLGIPGSEKARIRGLIAMVEDVPSYKNLTKLRLAYADSGQAQDAADVSPRVIQIMPSHLPPGYEHVSAARFSVAADDTAGALSYLREAVELGYPNAASLRADAAFAPLRETEAFQELTGR